MKDLFIRLTSALLLLSLLLVTACAPKEETLHIITTANLHGYGIDITTHQYINYLDILAYKQYLESKGHQVIVMDAGNSFHGALISNLDKGHSVMLSKQLVGYKVMGLANHDFNFGGDQLLKLHDLNLLPMVAANTAYLTYNPFLNYYNIKVSDSLDILVLGVITPDVYSKVYRPNIRGWDFYDPVPIAIDIANKIGSQTGPIIILGSLGLKNEEASDELLANIDALGLIIDSDRFYVDNKIRKERIIEVAPDAKGFTHTIVKIRNKRIHSSHSSVIGLQQLETLPLRYNTREIKKLQDLLSTTQIQREDYINHTIMTLYRSLNGTRGVVRQPNSALPNLVANSQLSLTNSDIALVNSGLIRTSLLAGEVKHLHVHDVLAFGNTIVTIYLSGKDIIDCLNLSYSNYPKNTSAFIHTAGMRYSVNPKAPVGHRISEVYVGDKPLDLSANYLVATNSFLVSGGDEYTMLRKPVIDQYGSDADVLIEYLTNYGQAAIDSVITDAVTIIEN